jgi:hypothetical protein
MVFIEVFKTNHDYKFFIYFYSTFSQIWLIPLMDDLTSQNYKKISNCGYLINNLNITNAFAIIVHLIIADVIL